MSPPAGLFQVVTFATDLVRGNPAFVATDPGAPDDRLAGLCATLGAGVLAVVDGPAEAEPRLRFFTAEGPHPGAGHATLAAAHVVLRPSPADRGDTIRDVTFRLADGGRRTARQSSGRIGIGFPAMAATPVAATSAEAAAIGRALGARPSEIFVADFGYVAVFDEAATVGALVPDLTAVATLDRNALIATAPGDGGSDVVIRVFAPKLDLPEDPVCGTAHRIIAPYWAARLGKSALHSRHLSPRGGDLWCAVDGDTVIIAGESRLVVAGTADLGDR